MYTDVEKIGQWVQKCMMVVRKCDVVVKKWVVGAKKHDGPIVVVKKQVMVVKKKKVDAKNTGGYEKNAEQYPIPQTGLGQVCPRANQGRPCPWTV